MGLKVLCKSILWLNPNVVITPTPEAQETEVMTCQVKTSVSLTKYPHRMLSLKLAGRLSQIDATERFHLIFPALWVHFKIQDGVAGFCQLGLLSSVPS